MAMETTIFQAVICLFLFRLTSAVVICPNTETNAIYHGRQHWKIPDTMTTYNDTDLASCSVFCRQDTNCKSFAVAENTCMLYSIQVGKNTRKLVKDIKSVHFDGVQVTPKIESRFGTCSVGNLCENGASCVNDCSVRGYSCICAESFRGINCEHKLTNRLSLQATIPLIEPRRLTQFWSKDRLYIVVANAVSPEGLYVFKYNVQMSTYEQMQFIEDSLVLRVRVFTTEDGVYVSKAKFYSTDPMHVYRFNPETEQFEDTFTIECGYCSTSFFQDSRGDSSLFVARFQNPDKTTNSEMYSFTRDAIGGEYSQLIETNGIDDSHMFEIDGSNYLVMAQTRNTGGDLQDTLIYRQRHDYGKPATASVFAIFIQSKECYTATDGVDYQGIVSTTTDGYTCQKWTDQTPHTHSYSPEAAPGFGLGDHNYCRNPSSHTQPWCYTTSAERWQNCDVGSPVTSCNPWTPWFNRDNPSGSGDWETVSDLYSENPSIMCDNPTAIECQTINGLPYTSTGEIVSCTTYGLVCKNEDQTVGECSDYRVRFFCPG
ncbi:uncharacterized protein [Antedon mediterranea]|uniref:uncharacterized protein n=1 Tax=Antedon mediterranea TaxID=105859 RepID=UPI003AF9B8B2